LNRPKFKDYITAEEIQEAILIHLKITRKYHSLLIHPFFADADDDYLLALARKGKANYIVTGDKVVLNATQIEDIKIISFHIFLGML
jgi:predicted nucleic acid-binding protein